MTPHEQAIRAHCKAHGIRIEQLPSGALRFTGAGVDVIVSDLRALTAKDLTPYEPELDDLRRA